MRKRKRFEVPYCEDPAVGLGAPECSEDCYRYGACNKDAYFKFIEENASRVEEPEHSYNENVYPHATGLYTCHVCGKKVETAYFDGDNGPSICIKCKNKKEMEEGITISTNYQFTHFVIDGREYYSDEIIEILKKHKEEEDKKYDKCERCGDRITNNTFNMVRCNLDKKPGDGCAWGYSVTPYIRGFKVLSTCGDGREIKLCDKCIGELVNWIDKG